MYEIENEDVYEDLYGNKETLEKWFDTSDYPKDSPYYNESNKKVIGTMKHEAAGVIIVEFIGLKRKKVERSTRRLRE